MTLAVLSPQRAQDLFPFTPLGCDTCAPVRGSVARFVIEFEVMHRGEPEGQRWAVCPVCLPSCLEAVAAQHQGFTPPVVSVLPAADTFRSVA